MHFRQWRRRAFIAALGGAAAWPMVARGQQTDGMRRIGVLSSLSAHDRTAQLRLGALEQGLQHAGWIEGRNIQIERRWSAGNVDNLRGYAAELVALAPDAVVANGSAATTLLSQATSTVPIVFTDVPDPVGAGFVGNLARPGRNITGFMLFEYSIGGKWLELLKEIAPTVTQAAVLRDPTMVAGVSQFAAIQAVAASLGVDLRKLPTVYSFGYYAVSGGLIAYGPDPNDPFRRAADYIDRILKGEKPGDLPVQAPTKYELVINLKTAKALGLEVPHSILARADEVLE
jgi:putative ABC transport system substrate-binding protein